jgi:TolB protein
VAISPDRRTAALRGAGGVDEQTCGGRSRVSARGRWEPLSFAPDGRRLLIGSCSRDRCTLAVAGGGASFAVIGRKPAVAAPAWSPDSRRLAFLGTDGAVVVANASTGHADTVAAEGGDSVVTPPRWSDGATILYGSHTSGVESNLYTLDPASGTTRLVARAAADPAWSPDGKTLAFQTPAGIWLTGSAAGARPRLWLKRAAAGLAWSPDGTRLAFLDGARVLIVDRVGSVRPVIGPIEGIALSAWSPDGSWLAYSVPSWGAGSGIWIVHPDGSDNHLFVPQATNLVWSPDGTHLAYIENSRLWVADATAMLPPRSQATSKQLSPGRPRTESSLST